jgi:hypothetical protein
MKNSYGINKKYALLLTAVLFPAISFAALDGVKGLLSAIREILGLIVPIVVGLAVIYFFWGLAQFILHSNDSKVRDEGRSRMIWGIVALFVIFSIFGIINWIGSTIGIEVGGTPNNSTCVPGSMYYPSC